MLAARTPFWKVIAWPSQHVQMPFDLARDPAELDNLVGERPWMYAGLGLQIRNHRRRWSLAGFEGEEVEITEEAAEALRALGYLD